MSDLVPAFNNHLPVKVRFGDGTAAELVPILRGLGATSVLLLVDDGIAQFNPAAATVIDTLETEFGTSLARYDKPAGEPTIAMVDDATAALAGSGAQAVVALGGGSVIDTAKAARLCAQKGVSFAEFLAGDRTYPEPTVALVALPTSAGTGSEVSGGAVISDPAAGRKAGIANALMRAQVAIVDPVLTHSMPPSMTAHTGIDALAQAIAAMVAKCRTPIGDGIALEAVRLAGESLVAAYRDGSDAVARNKMACAAMMAGLAMNISDCTAEHSLGQAIGGVKHVPHGLTIGLVVAETLDRERAYVPEALERVADALGEPRDGTSDGTRAVRAMRRILAELDFPVLSSLEFTDADIDHLADLALEDFFITQAPEPWSKDEVVAAFAAALALKSRAA
jgi:alcohol dehydrogenase class IV